MKESNIARRRFLKTVGLSAAFGASVGCTNGRGALGKGVSQRAGLGVAQRFAPVEVSSDRVIRTVVGLRPYRPSGFVLKSERFDDKIIIHNYGHGGAGVTLSWGTATLAIREALKTEANRFAVIGCGVAHHIKSSGIW